jgi:hypothetical protein
MEKFTLINYHQTRDFSSKMSVTFEFIRQNFKSLGKSILFIAGPPVLLASLLMGSFFQDMMSASMGASMRGDREAVSAIFESPTFWLQILLVVVFIMTSTVATIATIYNYVLLYEEKRTNNVEVSDVWTRVRQTFGMYLGTAILTTLLAIVVYTLLILPVVALAMVSPFLIFFGVIGVIVGAFYVGVSTSLIFIIRAYEKTGFFDSIIRSFRLVRGKWWSTFGLIVVLYLIAVVVSLIFEIPWYVISMVTTLHSVGVEGMEKPGSTMQIAGLLFLSLYYLAQMLLYSLPYVGIAFQYFNLVERKEATGLISQIDSIGQSPAPAPPADEHY